MYPQADIPCVQLSLLNSLDPLAHIQMGEALKALSKDNLLMIGSGFSFHNLKAFFSPNTAEAAHNNQAFEAWLLETCRSQTLTEAQRVQRLLAWKDAPGATFCHPREEHLLPLHVCYGLAGGPCTMAFELDIMGKRSSMYGWRVQEAACNGVP